MKIVTELVSVTLITLALVSCQTIMSYKSLRAKVCEIIQIFYLSLMLLFNISNWFFYLFNVSNTRILSEIRNLTTVSASGHFQSSQTLERDCVRLWVSY